MTTEDEPWPPPLRMNDKENHLNQACSSDVTDPQAEILYAMARGADPHLFSLADAVLPVGASGSHSACFPPQKRRAPASKYRHNMSQ